MHVVDFVVVAIMHQSYLFCVANDIACASKSCIVGKESEFPVT